jgi:hypothetical protein
MHEHVCLSASKRLSVLKKERVPAKHEPSLPAQSLTQNRRA